MKLTDMLPESATEVEYVTLKKGELFTYKDDKTGHIGKKIGPKSYTDQRGRKHAIDNGDRVVRVRNESFLAERKSKSNYEIYHKTLTSAASEALLLVKKRGYVVVDDSWFNQVATGPRKPQPGKTNSYKIELTKNDKPVKNMLVFQVYGLDGPTNNNYELTAYIS